MHSDLLLQDFSSSSNAKTIFSELVASLTASLVTEQKDCEKRKLVLHNVPEQATTNNSARKETQVNSILSEYVDVKPTIKNAVRLGKKLPIRLVYSQYYVINSN